MKTISTRKLKKGMFIFDNVTLDVNKEVKNFIGKVTRISKKISDREKNNPGQCFFCMPLRLNWEKWLDDINPSPEKNPRVVVRWKSHFNIVKQEEIEGIINLLNL